jgi:hypothetical protein
MAAAFLDKILSLFANSSQDPDAAKKKQLKQLVKEITGNKYARFYKPKSEEVEGALGKFFWDIYKIISPAQVFMQNAAKSAALKQITVEAFLDKNLQELRNSISAETIEEKAKTAAIKDLAPVLKKNLAAFSGAFDTERTNGIDRCYNLILAFIRFVSYDFFFLLKKFDSNISERNFTYIPKFANIRGEYLSDDLKDFLEISFGVDPDQDWKNALRVLKLFKNGVDVISADHWNRLLVQLRDIRKSGIFELMIRHIDNNPVWQSKTKLSDEHIAEAYLEARRNETKTAVDKIVNSKKNAQIDMLAKTIFGAVEIERMKYYSEKTSEMYTKKNFDGFLYARALSYLKAFMLDYFKKDIRELCDIILIRGQWTAANLSQQMSEGFHEFMALVDTLLAFDETFSDEGENGSRLKASLIKSDRDKSQARYVTVILKSVNEEAQNIIIAAGKSLIVVGRNLKGLIDDYQKPHHELIINWKELEGVSEVPLGQRMTDTYKRIYYLIQMMQFYAKPQEPEA